MRTTLGAWLCALALATGCATVNREVKTPRYTLSMPDFWEVKSEGMADGAATTVVIGRYGSAIIDEGSGSIENKAANYESVQADVQVRVYAWPEPPEGGAPSVAVANRLAADGELVLRRHVNVPDQPPECGLLKKRYDVLKTTQEPIDLVSRPGWRTIVVGGVGEGSLVGVVARVEFEQDVGRYCHNLSNMQVQLQNLLDGLKVVPQGSGSAPTPPPAAVPPAASPEASPATPEAPAAVPPASGSPPSES